MGSDMYDSIRLVTVLALVFSSLDVARAAPQPTQVLGELAAGTTVTVRGNSFGTAGPNILLFEDFESASPGSRVKASDPPIGSWDLLSNDPVIRADARSGNGALDSYDGSNQRQLRLLLGQKQREIFLSYWVRVPPGTRFPGSTSGSGRFSSDSSWKLTWLMDTDRGYENNNLFDLCLPTHTGNGSFQLAGNTYLVSDRYISNGWWSWNHWMRISTWIRDPTQKSPGGRFEAVSADKGHYVHNFGSPSTPVSYSSQVFDVFNIPGWIRNNGGSSISPRYDDIYVSVGPGAAARVELANSPNYSNASRVELLLVESWNATEVSARVPRSVDLSGQSWYVFVTDASGARNNTGLKAVACDNCDAKPKPPMLMLN